jgi:protein-L-isoaspartate(D-aspartate) O-methyltransferase
MVDGQLRRRGIRDERVLAAMGEIPREAFLPLEVRIASYGDAPAQIGYGQTISQPFMTALMAQLLELRGGETVLEIGAGCGYAAAVLGALAARVFAIEIVEPLALRARENLRKTGRDSNITVICGDGSAGLPGEAPLDAISVAAAAPSVPPELVAQLRDPGILTIPVGEFDDQELLVIRKRAGQIHTRTASLCRFVPLRGGGGWR